ncbi:MAG: D-amino-acid oxidase [Sphingomonas bacterium]|nr:FAD-dependent oxidoreductase [Sphingomonas bacterium]MDB5690130.1 D-amino-acid oxidase [Sphingomonas bacterium]
MNERQYDRRRFLHGGAAGLGALGLLALPGVRSAARAAGPLFDPVGPIVPIRALPDRLFRITVCLRPFRAVGPRIETEQVGRKLIVHNYGHGGSGWSLSWGSAAVAVRKAFEAGGTGDIAVIGAGALGLTAALTAQRAGARSVTIYARERFPDVRSARATGTWSPDSRVALTDQVGPEFAAAWEQMTRQSFATYQSYLGMPGNPVEWTDRYSLSQDPPMPAGGAAHGQSAMAGFIDLGDRVRDLTPRAQELAPGQHPFPVPFARRNSSLTFNVSTLSHLLTEDFLAAGGRIEHAEFHEPADLGRLKQKTIINCTGYGARALWKDESIVPVRGQIAWLIPQEGVNYGLSYKHLSVLARRDGIVVQDLGADDRFGYNDANETVDRAAAEASVAVLAEIFAGAAAPGAAPVPALQG